jgi:hypothetical protein
MTTDRDRLAALVAHWREQARKMLVPFPGLEKNLPSAALLESCADELARLLTAEAHEGGDANGGVAVRESNNQPRSAATGGSHPVEQHAHLLTAEAAPPQEQEEPRLNGTTVKTLAHALLTLPADKHTAPVWVNYGEEGDEAIKGLYVATDGRVFVTHMELVSRHSDPARGGAGR